MDIHVRRLGTLNILFGVVSLLAGSLLLLLFGGPMGMYRSTDDNILGLLMAVLAVGHVLLAIPCIVGGIFLKSLQEWSRGMLIITSALNIINVPVGSMLGAYGLWVLLAEETDPLFMRDSAPRVANKGVAQGIAPTAEAKSAALQNKTSTTIVPSPRS